MRSTAQPQAEQPGPPSQTGANHPHNGMPILTGGGSPAEHLTEETRDFYLRSLKVLDDAGIRYAVGGAYSLAHYAGIVRHTKDLDVFVRHHDCQRVLDVFKKAGYRTEMTHPHWLGKAYERDDFIDVIYGSGNGLCRVDDEWMDHAVEGDVLGRRAPLCPAEEIIWSKSFVQERNRFDGADIHHLLLARGHEFDWPRLMRRFAGHERVLLSHLIVFGYVYPSERGQVPVRVIAELMDRVRGEPPTGERVCRGTALSWSQYLIDVRERGFADGRLKPHGLMSPEQVERWTEAEK
jgi:hypothetical protein